MFKLSVDDEPRDSFDETRAQTIGIQWTEFVIAAAFTQDEELPQLTFIESNLPTFYDYTHGGDDILAVNLPSRRPLIEPDKTMFFSPKNCVNQKPDCLAKNNRAFFSPN